MNFLTTMPQKRLKTLHFLCTALYFIVTFGFSIIYASKKLVFEKAINENISTTVKFSVFACIILICFVLLSINTLRKQISKINIRNLDGTYNTFWLVIKSTLTTLLKIAPIVIVLALLFYVRIKLFSIIDVGVGKSIDVLQQSVIELKNLIQYYYKFVAHLAGFFITGSIIDNTIVSYLEYELDVRRDVANKLAVDKRIASLSKIK